MRDRYVLDDCQSQPGSPRCLTATFIDAIKTLGEARNVLGIDTEALVLYEQFGAHRCQKHRRSD